MNFNKSNNLPITLHNRIYYLEKHMRTKATNYHGTQHGMKLISIKRPLFVISPYRLVRMSSPSLFRCKLLSNPSLVLFAPRNSRNLSNSSIRQSVKERSREH